MAAGRAVLYVALITMVAVPATQLREVADRLDQAGMDFIWAVRPSDANLDAGFEERVAGRGRVVTGEGMGRPVGDRSARVREGVSQLLRVELGGGERHRWCAASGVADGH